MEMRCPACGADGAHWEPDRLDAETGGVVRGYFTCQRDACDLADDAPALLDLEGL